MDTLSVFISMCLALTLSLAISGCELLSSNGSGVQINTDKATYSFEPSTSIHLEATSHLDRTVYYGCKGGVLLQELKEGDVAMSWFVHGFEQCGPTPFEPGQRVQFEFPLQSPFLIDRLADGTFDKSVRYRFAVNLYEDQGLQDFVAEEDRLSNEFVIIK